MISQLTRPEQHTETPPPASAICGYVSVIHTRLEELGAKFAKGIRSARSFLMEVMGRTVLEDKESG